LQQQLLQDKQLDVILYTHQFSEISSGITDRLKLVDLRAMPLEMGNGDRFSRMFLRRKSCLINDMYWSCFMLKSTHELVIIRAPKRLDALTTPHLVLDLETKLSQGISVVLDLSKTQTVEPNSADVILHGLMLAKQRHARFSLRGVSQTVQLVLETAGVLHFFRKS
jgi:anti-anti-sigma regulatory factor